MDKHIREDHSGPHRQAFERNRKKIYATRTLCGICGRPVDFSLRYPNPMAPSIDHIIPIDRGGHPSDIDNLQLAHWTCNRQKGDKLRESKDTPPPARRVELSNRNLPQTTDWSNFSAMSGA